MTRSRIAALSLAALATLGPVAGCGGSSKTKTDDTTTTTEAPASTSTTKASSGSTSTTESTFPRVTYLSCTNQVLTVALTPGAGATSITKAYVSRIGGEKGAPENPLTKGADGNWSGTIPEAKYGNTLVVGATNDQNKPYTRNSQFPMSWDGMKVTNCS